MKARPILFSGAMVRALLAGSKTQTRRIVKPQPDSVKDFGRLIPYRLAKPPADMPSATLHTPILCPYGVPGDLLIVREAHALVPASAYRMSEGVHQTVNPTDPYQAAIYAAGWDRSIPKWRPSIHMPRWACRLTLEITEVRVERLQDISAADAIAEGIYRVDPDADDLANGCTPDDFVYMAPGTRQGWGMTKEERAREQWGPDPVFAYRCLWEAINGPGSCSSNPWVWAVSFKVHQQNVDALLRGMAA